MTVTMEKEVCENGNCFVETNGEYDAIVKRNLNYFYIALAETTNLQVIGVYEDDEDILIIQNNDLKPKTLGHQVEVDQKEIMAHCDSPDKAKQYVKLINGDRNGTVLHGITRIVGYYARMGNWNKSKIGELRDRKQLNYMITEKIAVFDDERLKTIDRIK